MRPQSMKRITGYLLLPMWAGLLVLPFAGQYKAFTATAVGLLVVVLWRLLTSGPVAAMRDPLAAHVSSIRDRCSSLFSLATSPRVILVIIACFVILPIFLNDYFQDILTLIGMYIILALGLNIVVGQAGLLNLGYVAFYAIGAYTYAILSTTLGVTFWPGLAIGGLSAALCAVLLGAMTLKLRGDYFAIVTLGLGEITRIVLNNWDSLTHGPNGISGIGQPVLGGYTFHKTLDFYYLVLFLASIVIFSLHRIISSRIGRAWIAIREDEIAAEAMGINIYVLKLLAFVIGSAVAGIAGVFFAAKMAFVSPESFTFTESVMILCMVVLGGMGSIPGIILGAFLLIGLPEMFRDFQDYRMLAFGSALVLMMIFRPQGILGSGKINIKT